MTGLRIMSLGSSLRNAPQIAGRMIAGSNKELTLRRGLSLVFINFASRSPEMFHVKHLVFFATFSDKERAFTPPGQCCAAIKRGYRRASRDVPRSGREPGRERRSGRR